MKKTLTFLLSFFWALPLLFSGNIEIGDGTTPTRMRVTANTYEQLKFENRVSNISFYKVRHENDVFTQLKIDGYGFSMVEGSPRLPVLKKLIEIPIGAEIEVDISRQHSVEYHLGDYGVDNFLFPAQPSLFKNQDPGEVPFVFNTAAYQEDKSTGQELVKVTELGTMRGVRLARVEIAPVLYNPVQNTIEVYDRLDVTVRFENADMGATLQKKKEGFSPYFEQVYHKLLNFKTADTKELITTSPVTYIIVADRMFETALAPFVEWKTKKGFRVVTAYTDMPEVGNTTESIKDYLEGFYNNPPDGYEPQSFVLFVGDVDQIPAFSGSAGYHVSDLYYCEYTDDNFPECYYGRFSANNVAELLPQINKTLEYEQYSFPDPSFLNEVVMIAGEDSNFGPLHGNGQINYGTENYFNADHGLNSHTYLQPEPSGGNYAANIRQDISNGVSFGNYTAHCSADGWAGPSFSISDIPSLANEHEYPLLIGNCCSSVEFDNDCFGEEILRAENKGAIGYIGGSNSTLWDEDYWWGVGYREEVVVDPVYEAGHRGAYDGLFHDNGEPVAQWYVPQGQIVSAGNLAVTESGSSNTLYYWEIYHLMGDPSLMVYLSVPPVATAGYPATAFVGQPSIDVTTNPYAYIGVSINGELLGAGIADSTGNATVTFFEPLTQLGEADIVITGQNLAPYTGTMVITADDVAWVSCTEGTVNDAGGNDNGQADYTETVTLNVSAKNFGTVDAGNVTGTLSTVDEYVEIIDSLYTFGDIAAEEMVSAEDIYEIVIADDAPDNHVAHFTITFSDGTDEWTGNIVVTLHAPVLNMGVTALVEPDGNGTFDAGETATLTIPALNIGSAGAYNATGNLTIYDDYISVTTSALSYGDINAGGDVSRTYEITAAENTPFGHTVTGTFVVTADYGVTATGTVTFTVGNFPVVIIDLDPNVSSGPVMANAMNALGVPPVYLDSFPDDLTIYSNAFVCLGVYSTNTKLTEAQAGKLVDFLNGGGHLYMEGSDTWCFDDATSVHPMFSVSSSCGDGESDLGIVLGVDGSFTEGMTLTYSGENSYMDQLALIEPAFSILENSDPAYVTAVAYDQGVYKTIAAGHEFGGFDDGDFPNTKVNLMSKYLNFFGIATQQTFTCAFSASDTVICAGESIQFNDLTIGEPTSWEWSIEGVDTVYTDPNPVVLFGEPGAYSITLTVTNDTDTSSMTQIGYIQVLDVPEMPAKPTGDTVVCYTDATVTTYSVVGNSQGEYYWRLVPVEAGSFNYDGDTVVAEVTWHAGWEGEAQISVKNVNDCGDSDYSQPLIVQVENCTVGLNELTGDGVRIYPNPNDGNFTLSLGEKWAGLTDVTVYNTLGEKITATRKTGNGEITKLAINTPGIYMLVLKNGARRLVKRIVVQ